jgi:hypothetical protein
VLPDGSLQVETRHGGVSHITIIPVDMLVEALPVSVTLKAQIMMAVRP